MSMSMNFDDSYRPGPRLLTTLALVTCFVTSVSAAEFTFTRIVDTNTAIPGGSGNFISFTDSFVSVDKGDVAFGAVIGTDSSGFPASGVYTYISGNLGKVADVNTPLPGGTGNFTDATEPWLENGSVAFAGSGNDQQWGFYTNLGGSLRVVADTNTPAPGGTGTFFIFQDTASLSAGVISFHGRFDGGG